MHLSAEAVGLVPALALAYLLSSRRNRPDRAQTAAAAVGLALLFLAFFDESHSLLKLSDRLSTPGAQTILRIPLFVAFIALLVAGSRRLRSAAPAVGLRDGARE